VTALGQGTRLGLALVSLAAAMHNIWRVLILDTPFRLFYSVPVQNKILIFIFIKQRRIYDA